MSQYARVLIVPMIVSLAACASTAPVTQPVMVAAPAPVVSTLPTTPLGPTSAPQATTVALQTTDVAPFIDPSALGLLGANERGEASSAQFYALQYGRPGAPRQWQAGSTKGTVSVGPYVRVNNLDCRDFTHAITISGTSYSKKGTACRETDGRWTVVS